MQDVTSLPAQRVAVTDVSRKDASTGATGMAQKAQPAMPGQQNGKSVPVADSVQTAARQHAVMAESRETVERAIAQVNDYVQSIQRDLHFSMDEGSGKSIVRVIDRSTEEVVRQIPSDVVLRLARNLSVQQQQGYDRQASAEAGAVDVLGLINTRI